MGEKWSKMKKSGQKDNKNSQKDNKKQQKRRQCVLELRSNSTKSASNVPIDVPFADHFGCSIFDCAAKGAQEMIGTENVAQAEIWREKSVSGHVVGKEC